MKKNRLLTVIVPTYNMEKYLDKCLTSLILQDHELMNHLEVLVIIDGATDRSSEIAHGYEKKYPETFRVVDKENGNYGSCINRGLKEATGKYIKVLDADDYFDTVNFENHLLSLKNLNVDLVITDCDEVNDDDIIVSKMTCKDIIEPHCKLSFQDLIQTDFSSRCQMHCITYKTENLKKISYHQTEGIAYTDQEWIFLPMTTVNDVYYNNIVLYKYLVGRAGQTVDFSVASKRFGERAKLVFSLIDSYQKSRCDSIYQQYLLERLKTNLYYTIYHYGLIDGAYTNEQLRSFDQEFKLHYPDFYKYSVKLFSDSSGMEYIQKWRDGRFVFYINNPRRFLSVLKRKILHVCKNKK